MKKINQSGFSLVEVMVTGAIVSVITLGVMKLTESVNKTSKNLGQKVDIVQLQSIVQPAFLDSKACQYSFAGKTLVNGGNAGTDGLKNKSNYRILPDPGVNGSKYGNILIERIVFESVQDLPLPPTATTATMNNLAGVPVNVVERQGAVRFDIRKGTSRDDDIDRKLTIGVLNQKISIPVTFYVVDDLAKNQIIGCYGNDVAYMAAICNAFGGVLENNLCKSLNISSTAAPANPFAATFRGDVAITSVGAVGGGAGTLSVTGDTILGQGALGPTKKLCLSDATAPNCISSWGIQVEDSGCETFRYSNPVIDSSQEKAWASRTCTTRAAGCKADEYVASVVVTDLGAGPITSAKCCKDEYNVTCPLGKFAVGYGAWAKDGILMKTISCCNGKVR